MESTDLTEPHFGRWPKIKENAVVAHFFWSLVKICPKVPNFGDMFWSHSHLGHRTLGKVVRREVNNLAFDTLPLEEVVKAFQDNKEQAPPTKET